MYVSHKQAGGVSRRGGEQPSSWAFFAVYRIPGNRDNGSLSRCQPENCCTALPDQWLSERRSYAAGAGGLLWRL